MRTGHKRLVAVLFIAMLFGLPLGMAEGRWDLYVGTWKGHIQAGAVELLTVVHLQIGDDGALRGSVDSPEQGVFGIPVSGVSRNDDGSVTVEIPAAQATYVATLSDDHGKLTGDWNQRGASLPLELARSEPEKKAPIEGVDRFVGTWEGKLDLGGMSLRIVYHFQAGEEGQLKGTMDSPDQGVEGVPIGRIESPSAGTIKLFVSNAVFEGELKEKAASSKEGAPEQSSITLEGEFRQAGMVLPLVLTKVEKVSELSRPQTPEPPFPYEQREVSYDGLGEGVKLAGTLTLPKQGGPFAAALLITGSGAQDRDETIFGHKPFLVLADDLTRRGIAVLRVDDRGVGGSTGVWGTSADFADDVRAGMAFLAGVDQIDPRRIGLIGHSEGGLIAPMVAAGSEEVAFIVMIAGPGVPGDQLLYSQSRAMGLAAGGTEEQIAANRKTQERLFAVMKDEQLDAEQAAQKMRKILENDPNVPEGEDREQYVSMQLPKVASEWMKFFVRYDPVPALEKVTCPVLAINGSLDLQVPAAENLGAIGKALEKAGNPRVTLAEMPGLNHLLQKAPTGMVAEYATIEETIDPAALKKIGKWVTEQVKPPEE